MTAPPERAALTALIEDRPLAAALCVLVAIALLLSPYLGPQLLERLTP